MKTLDEVIAEIGNLPSMMQAPPNMAIMKKDVIKILRASWPEQGYTEMETITAFQKWWNNEADVFVRSGVDGAIAATWQIRNLDIDSFLTQLKQEGEK
jgi:hypothetical protein